LQNATTFGNGAGRVGHAGVASPCDRAICLFDGPSACQTKPFAIAREHGLVIAITLQPTGHLGVGNARSRLRLGQRFQLGGNIGQVENHEGQAKGRDKHHTDAAG
jgi:hypothetical protein